MLALAIREVQRLGPSGCGRAELCDQLTSVARLQTALDERRLALVSALEALGDNGPDAASVIRSTSRCSSMAASPVPFLDN